MESPFAGAVDGLVDIAKAGQREQPLRNIVLDPCSRAQGRERIVLQKALLD